MKKIMFLMGLGFALTVQAQDYDFGDVSKEELQEKYNPLDSTANATYLYKKRNTYFEYVQSEGFILVTQIHERIKIYNQEGFDYASKEIRLYVSRNDDEDVSKIKGYTYNLTDGKIEEDKLGKNAIFKSELNKYNNQVKFTLPNIKPGSVIEYKYEIRSPFWSNVDEFVFQYGIPVKKLEARFEVPEYFNFKLNTKGFIAIKPQTETQSGKITFRSKTRSEGNLTSVASTTFDSYDVDFNKNITNYNLENIPALKEEPYVNNINNYRSSIKYELSYTKFPQSSIEHYSTSWEDVIKRIYKSDNFGNELDKTGYFSKDIDALIDSISDPMTRASLIYDYVKSRIKWNGYYGYIVDKGVKSAYKDQVGNVAEINLMLTAMLNYAGVNAYPVLVSTRQHGVPVFPTREGYNYVVTYIKDAGQEILLDATSKYGTPNVLPFRALNWQGRVITEHGNSTLIDLYPKDVSKTQVSMMIDLEDTGDILGNYRSTRTNLNALSYRESYNESNKDQFLEKLENDYDGMEVSDFEVKNDSDLSKPITESYRFVKENQADIISNKMYFSPLFFFSSDENPFKLEKREFPVDFGYPSLTSYRVIIKIPEGYKIESIPEPAAIGLPDNLGSFKYNIVGSGSNIQVLVETQINQSIISSLYYDALKMYFSKLVEKEAEQIVLTKV